MRAVTDLPYFSFKIATTLNLTLECKTAGFGVDFLKFWPFFDTFDFQPPISSLFWPKRPECNKLNSNGTDYEHTIIAGAFKI